ncbi:uncharacterized protein LOC144918677 [Branchiostoma floridae x Branchiostoma belcheri]
MARFPYSSARGLGGMQIFLGLAAMGLGAGDLDIGLSTMRYHGPGFRLYMLGAGIWTGLFFLIAGSLAASISEGRTAGCKIGAAQTMALLNTFIFAPGLTGVATVNFIMGSTEWNYSMSHVYDNTIIYVDVSSLYRLMTYLDVSLAVVGGLEFIFSIATASVCCCGGSYDQPATNQIVPMPMVTFQPTIQQPVVPAPRPSYGFAERPSTTMPAGAATGGDGQMVTLPAAELGVLYAKANNSAVEE